MILVSVADTETRCWSYTKYANIENIHIGFLTKFDAQNSEGYLNTTPYVPSNEAFVGEWRPGLLYLKKLKEEE